MCCVMPVPQQSQRRMEVKGRQGEWREEREERVREREVEREERESGRDSLTAVCRKFNPADGEY